MITTMMAVILNVGSYISMRQQSWLASVAGIRVVSEVLLGIGLRVNVSD